MTTHRHCCCETPGFECAWLFLRVKVFDQRTVILPTPDISLWAWQFKGFSGPTDKYGNFIFNANSEGGGFTTCGAIKGDISDFQRPLIYGQRLGVPIENAIFDSSKLGTIPGDDLAWRPKTRDDPDIPPARVFVSGALIFPKKYSEFSIKNVSNGVYTYTVKPRSPVWNTFIDTTLTSIGARERDDFKIISYEIGQQLFQQNAGDVSADVQFTSSVPVFFEDFKLGAGQQFSYSLASPMSLSKTCIDEQQIGDKIVSAQGLCARLGNIPCCYGGFFPGYGNIPEIIYAFKVSFSSCKGLTFIDDYIQEDPDAPIPPQTLNITNVEFVNTISLRKYLITSDKRCPTELPEECAYIDGQLGKTTCRNGEGANYYKYSIDRSSCDPLEGLGKGPVLDFKNASCENLQMLPCNGNGGSNQDCSNALWECSPNGAGNGWNVLRSKTTYTFSSPGFPYSMFSCNAPGYVEEEIDDNVVDYRQAALQTGPNGEYSLTDPFDFSLYPQCNVPDESTSYPDGSNYTKTTVCYVVNQAAPICSPQAVENWSSKRIRRETSGGATPGDPDACFGWPTAGLYPDPGDPRLTGFISQDGMFVYGGAQQTFNTCTCSLPVGPCPACCCCGRGLCPTACDNYNCCPDDNGNYSNYWKTEYVPDASIIEPNPYLIYDSAHVETRSSGKQKINFTSWANSYLQAFKRHTGKYTEHTGYGAYVPNTTCGFMSLPFTLWNPDAPIIGTDFSGLLDLAGITLPPGHKTSFPARRGYNQVLDKCWEGLSELPNPFTICRDTYSTTKIKFLDNNYSYGVDKSCSGPVRTKGFLEYDDVANYYYTGQLQILQNSGWYIRLKQYFETENINYYYKKRGITIENMEVFKKTGIRSFNITGCTDVMDRAFITSLPTTTI